MKLFKYLALSATTLIGTSLFSSGVLAHPGHDTVSTSMLASFSEGLLHPITGWDHLIALVGFGVIIGLSKGAKTKSVAALMLALIGGMGLGVIGSSFIQSASMAESVVTLSLVALPVFAIVNRIYGKMHTAGLVAMALFSATHGWVQGFEAVNTLYMVGIATGSIGLLLASAYVSIWLSNERDNTLVSNSI